MSAVSWFAPVVPEARVAVLRTVLYLFVLVDLHLIVRDPVSLSAQPELYRPLMLARLLHLPPPSVALTAALYVVLLVGCGVAAANRLPRLAGFVVAAAFTWWVAIGFSFGKVDHDHLALVVALWVLPTVGAVPGRWRAVRASAQAGWALKCVQIAVVATYFLSALTKIRNGDWSLTSWPNSAILTWAVIRRPHGLGQFLVHFPDLLRAMQWFSFCAELGSVVVLWLRGRALLLAALFWLGFHVMIIAVLYIHFAPTVICWLAFAPLERWPAWLAALRGGVRGSSPSDGTALRGRSRGSSPSDGTALRGRSRGSSASTDSALRGGARGSSPSTDSASLRRVVGGRLRRGQRAGGGAARQPAAVAGDQAVDHRG